MISAFNANRFSTEIKFEIQYSTDSLTIRCSGHGMAKYCNDYWFTVLVMAKLYFKVDGLWMKLHVCNKPSRECWDQKNYVQNFGPHLLFDSYCHTKLLHWSGEIITLTTLWLYSAPDAVNINTSNEVTVYSCHCSILSIFSGQVSIG